MALLRGIFGPPEDGVFLQLFDSRFDWPLSENLTSTIEQGMVPTSASTSIQVSLPLEDFVEPNLELDGDVQSKIVPGGLWEGAGGDPRAINHDETQRAALIEWRGIAEVSVILVDAGDPPLDLSSSFTHLLCRIQRRKF